MWRHPCQSDIINDLVSETNPGGNITNPAIELAALVLHKASLLVLFPEARMAMSRSGSNNTPTVLWSMGEAPTINSVVADFLRIRVFHSRKFSLNPYILYHPDQDNYIADDASCLFDLLYTSFLTHMSSAYPQLLSSW